MPFTKVGKDDYTSPSGRHFNQAQVRLYYAHDGFPGQKKAGGGPVNAKTSTLLPANLAKGGPVLREGRSQFMKTPDVFRTDIERNDYGGGKDPLANRQGDGKSLKPIKPRT